MGVRDEAMSEKDTHENERKEAGNDPAPPPADELPEHNRDPFQVSFDGAQDPMCPHSMPIFRKWLLVVIVCMGTVCVTCTSSIYTATYTQTNAEFGTSSLATTSGLSAFVMGIALGPSISSPLSEFYGRRPIYLVSWSLFIISTIPSAVAQNLETIATTRFFSGCFGGTFLSVAGGTVGDIFLPHEIQAPMALVSLAPFAGPCTGPLIGGFINYHLNWRWTYYIMIIWSCLVLLLIVPLAPETYHPVRLRAKAEALRKETGEDRYRAPIEKATVSKASALWTSILRPLQFIAYEPMCLCLNIFSAILLGILYLFFLAFPLIFRTHYAMNLWQIGLTFLGIISGMCLAATTAPVWSTIRVRLSEKHGSTQPEFRLPPAMFGGLLIPIGLFWFAWTGRYNIHWMVPIVGSAVFGCGTLLAFIGIFTFLVDAYTKYAASALASNGLTRCSLAATFPLFGIQMYERLGHQWAGSLLGFLTVMMLPFPWLFFRYGQRLRARSKFAVRSEKSTTAPH